MAIALTPTATTTFTLEADRDKPPEQQSKFFLGVPPPALNVFLSGLVQDCGGDSAKLSAESTMRLMFEMLRACLRGWENFPAGGDPIEFKSERHTLCGIPLQAASMESIALLDWTDAMEIATAAQAQQRITQDDRKN